jgi:MipA family protein
MTSMQQLLSKLLLNALACHRSGLLVSTLVALMTLTCPAIQAQTQTQNDEPSWHLGIALGHGQRTNPLIGGDDIDIPYVIDLAWYGEHWFFDNGDLGYTFLNEGRFSINGVVTYNNERNYYNYLTGKQFSLDILTGGTLGLAGNGSDSIVSVDISGTEFVKTASTSLGTTSTLPDGTTVTHVNVNANVAIASRHSAINGGLEFLYISPYGDVQAQVLTDISSTHDGQEAWLSWSRPWYTRRSEVTLTLGLEWKSTDLIGYYFGVNPAESFVGRPLYEGNSGTNAFVRLAGRYSLSEHWTLVGMLEREKLSSAITQSPIVNAEVVDSFFAGLFYSF